MMRQPLERGARGDRAAASAAPPRDGRRRTRKRAATPSDRRRPARSSTSAATTTSVSRRHPALAAAMAECAARIAARAAAPRTSSAATGASTPRSRRSSPPSPAARARCSSRPDTWPTSGVVTALAGRGESVLLDRLSHASLIDGASCPAHASGAIRTAMPQRRAGCWPRARRRQPCWPPTVCSAWTATSRRWRHCRRPPRAHDALAGRR